MILTQPLHKGRREKPDAMAVISGNTRLSFSRFTDRVSRLGSALRALDMGPGDRVGMMSFNSHRFVEFFFGVWWGGGVINPVNIRWNPKEVAYSLDDCDTRILLVDDTFAPLATELRTLSNSLRTVIYCGDGSVPNGMLNYQVLLEQCSPCEDAPHGADELAAIMYTGGTTGQVGEITARGPMVMRGYWNKPKETEEALRGGWMHTGDGGFMDEHGFLFVVDRIKDMIVSGGENIYSAEVENAIAQLPQVLMSAVIGVPDEKWGERVHAVVVLRPGATLEAEALIAHCRSQIAGYKSPRSVEFRDALPLSAAGKLQKFQVREPFWADHQRQVN